MSEVVLSEIVKSGFVVRDDPKVPIEVVGNKLVAMNESVVSVAVISEGEGLEARPSVSIVVVCDG